ncbi:hypothetical protein L6452_17001 [Arctium lappa]|uniref:Uncharacterized protein n=1 Tax=Arctium lappa TaxID=4217 RepID=A0ACB9C2I0_ARCLA|nr:hypothetical protein L6452_17001 [Arctium lappa]
MAIRQFTIIALVFFAIVGMAFAAADAPAPSASPGGGAASGGDGGGAGGATAGAPTGTDGLAGAPAEGPGATGDASTFKISSVVAVMNVVTAALGKNYS